MKNNNKELKIKAEYIKKYFIKYVISRISYGQGADDSPGIFDKELPAGAKRAVYNPFKYLFLL